jgi:hypothetical protein
LIDLEAIGARISKVVFCLGWHEDGKDCYGTGFFLNEQGLALTAYHNLPKRLLKSPDERMQAKVGAETIDLAWKLRASEDRAWQKAFDVAVLQGPAGLLDAKDRIACRHLPLGLLRKARAAYWRHTPVVVMGFAAAYGFGLSTPITGAVHGDEPIQDPLITRSLLEFLVYVPEAIAFGGAMSASLRTAGGLSGAPVYSPDHDAFVGVQFAIQGGTERFFFTEFHQIAKFGREFASEFAGGISTPASLSGPTEGSLALSPGPDLSALKRAQRWERLGKAAVAMLACLILAVAAVSVWRAIPVAPPPPLLPAFSADIGFELAVTKAGNAQQLRIAAAAPTRYTGLRSGDRLRIGVSVFQPAHLYIFAVEQQPARQTVRILFPSPSTRAGLSNLSPARQLSLPERSWLQLDAQKGTEQLWLVYSLSPIPALERLQRFANATDLGIVGSRTEARQTEDFIAALRRRAFNAVTVKEGTSVRIHGSGWCFAHLLELGG